MNKWIIIAPTASLILSEIALRIDSGFGLLFYGLLITGVLIALSNAKELNNEAKLLIFFLILPLLRISELFLNYGVFWDSVISYYILTFIVTFYLFKFRINPGFTKRGAILLPLGAIVGLSFGFIIYWLTGITIDGSLILILPIIAYSEEVLFRGLLQKTIKEIYGAIFAIIICATIYGVFSLYMGWDFAIAAGVFALVVGMVYSFSENIYLPIIMNFCMHLMILLKIGS